MLRIVVAALAALAPGLAVAHTGTGDASGFAHGIAHPLGGLDHVLAMVAVGLLAARIGGRALLLVPLSFLAMMAVGGALGAGGIGLPWVEAAIGLSVVALGVAVAIRSDLPLAAAMALVGAFAIFHGHAHGAEMPETASGLAYGVGFVAATAVLHAVGIGVGLAIGRVGDIRAGQIARLTGGAMALTGVAMLGGAI